MSNYEQKCSENAKCDKIQNLICDEDDFICKCNNMSYYDGNICGKVFFNAFNNHTF